MSEQSVDGMKQLPDVEEGDALVLDKRTKYSDGTVEWNRLETTVENVRKDGITVRYSNPNVAHCDLQMLLDYGDARLPYGTQGTLERFAADGGETGARAPTDTEQGGRADDGRYPPIFGSSSNRKYRSPQ